MEEMTGLLTGKSIGKTVTSCYGNSPLRQGDFMASETFKKRQKEAARREKQQKKAARRMERRHEKGTSEGTVSGENPNTAESVSRRGPTIL